MQRSSVFPVLFRLAARAPELTPAVFQKRLTTGIANHFGALWCALHMETAGWASVEADPAPLVEDLPQADRARLEEIQARLVRVTAEQQRMRSALDLEERRDVDEFLSSRLGVYDIFAFPVRNGARTFAVLVLYLGDESDPLDESDIEGLCSLGDLVKIAGTALDGQVQPQAGEDPPPA